MTTDGLPDFPVPVGSTVRIFGRRTDYMLVGWHGQGDRASVILLDAGQQQRHFVRFDNVQWEPPRPRRRRPRKGDGGHG